MFLANIALYKQTTYWFKEFISLFISMQCAETKFVILHCLKGMKSI